MKERPILFSAPLVHAILEGRKTQTRRAVKPAPDWDSPQLCCTETPEGWQGPLSTTEWAHEGDRSDGQLRRCPYGGRGDRLWVRETHQFDPPCDGSWAYTPWAGCKASTWRDIPERFQTPAHVLFGATWTGSQLTWRPSIHMPRWASRITLQITAVRVERLQDISQADAIAEGGPPSDPSINAISQEFGYADFPRSWFAQLWDQINGEGRWAANPWVWVVEFKRV